MIIPRIFHRAWVGPNPIPDAFQEYWEGWWKFHPDWQLNTWDEAAIDRLGLVNRAEYDAATEFAGKTDIAMHEILYRFGGIWLCCDMECFKNIEALLDDVPAFSGRENPYMLLGAIMGFIPEHPITAKLVEGIPESVRVNAAGPLTAVAGPLYLTEVVQKYLGVPAIEMDGREDFRVLPTNLVYPYPWNEPFLGSDSYPDAYCCHHWTGSWVKKES